ncbi:hypothetical protein [Geodermatophilus sp. URMC 64]
MSERVTWETCPRCGRSAAVGWVDGRAVEVDCPGGCALPSAEFARQKAKAEGTTSSVERWTAAMDRWL